MIIIILIHTRYYQCPSIVLEVIKEAAFGHERHDDIWSGSSIKTNTTQSKNIGVIKLVHLRALFQHISDCSAVIESYQFKEISSITC